MAVALTTKSLSAAVADTLAWLSDHGFRYFKSYNHFRRRNKNGFCYIMIDSFTRNRVVYHLAFYLGVRISEVESWILKLMGNNRKVNHQD